MTANLAWQTRIYLAVHFVVALLPAISRAAASGSAAPLFSILTFIGCMAFMPAALVWLAATWTALATRDARLIAFLIADFAILVLHFIAVLPEAQ